MRSRALLVAAALSGAACLPVQAADQSVPGGSVPSYYPAYYPGGIDWTGFYTGLQVGGAFTNFSGNNPFSGVAFNPAENSIIGGFQVGANWQREGFVVGIEADFTWMALSGTASDAAGFVDTFKSSWMVTTTARLGYAFNRALVYGKGGAAFAEERDKTAGVLGAANTSATTQIGWTVGIGVEYALTSEWSARLEYDYVDFPGHNLAMTGSLGLPGAICPCTTAFPVDYSIQKVVAAINYRF